MTSTKMRTITIWKNYPNCIQSSSYSYTFYKYILFLFKLCRERQGQVDEGSRSETALNPQLRTNRLWAIHGPVWYTYFRFSHSTDCPHRKRENSLKVLHRTPPPFGHRLREKLAALVYLSTLFRLFNFMLFYFFFSPLRARTAV